jgi:hypothetical protein
MGRIMVSLLFVTLGCASVRIAASQHLDAAPTAADSDHDGLSDNVEQALLQQFAPTFVVGRNDCSNVPAEFQAGNLIPSVTQEDGTIYGQAFLSKSYPPDHPTAELHFYHLWARDCGPHGHHLDTEHVAVLIRASDSDFASAKWKAVYWYAAAHENTLCDASQIVRASTVHAEENGAKVWISPGKHASFLNETLCQHGCGADKCFEPNMVALPAHGIINLGEVDHPMNGSVFISSREWPLSEKMSSSNFPPDVVARLERLPDSDIAWYNAGRHPIQPVLAAGASTEQAIGTGGHNTTAALSTAGNSTDTAISVAADSTGNALDKSYRSTKHALGTSVRHVGQALHITHKAADPESCAAPPN